MPAALRGSALLVAIAACLGSFLSTGALAAFNHGAETPGNTVATAALQPPSGLSATAGTDVVLSWDTSASENAAGYRIYRAASPGGPYTEIDEVTPADTDTYTDSPGSGDFHYVLRSFFENWESDVSAEVAASTGSGGGSVAVASGSYIGDGRGGRSVDGLGFQPDVVIVKCDCNRPAIVRTSTMSGDASKVFTNGGALVAGRIESLDADGFTLGRNNQVNRDGDTYYWVAIRAGDDISLGTYVGDGSDDRVIGGVGFRPEWVVTMGDGQQSWFKPAGASGEDSYRVNTDGPADNHIQAFRSDGFELGSHNQVNRSGVTFHYIAFNASSQVDTGTYTGDGADGRDVTGLDLRPDFLWIKSQAGSSAVWRPEGLSGDAAFEWDSGAAADRIQDVFNGGFQVGGHDSVNEAGVEYFYLAIED